MKDGYCIFRSTELQGEVPAVRDEDGKFVVFDTELEAQREIAESLVIRLQQFLSGDSDYETATNLDEYVVAVTLHDDGSLATEDGEFQP